MSESDLHLIRSLWLMADYAQKDAMTNIDSYSPDVQRSIRGAAKVLAEAALMIDRLTEESQAKTEH